MALLPPEPDQVGPLRAERRRGAGQKAQGPGKERQGDVPINSEPLITSSRVPAVEPPQFSI